IIPRKYFSGGTAFDTVDELLKQYKEGAPLDRQEQEVVGHFLAQDPAYNGENKVNVNLVEITPQGKSPNEIVEIVKPTKTSSLITEKKSKKKTFEISGRDKLDAYQFIVNFYQDGLQITIKLKEILKSMGTLMSSSDPVTFSVDLASGNKLTRYDIVSIVKDVIDSYSSDPKYLRVLDNPSGRRTYMEETMGPLIRHILLPATTGSSPITGKEPETRVSGKDKHNVYGYDVSFRQDDSEVTIKLAKTSEPSSDSTTFTIKRATGNTLTPSDVASILENVIKVYSFAPGYLIAQEHVEELKYMTTKIAKILKMVTTVASQEHADYMPSTDKFGLYNFDVNFHPSDCEITIKLTKTSEMKISGFLPTGETFIVKRAPDNKLTSSDIASIVAKIIEAYSSDPDYLSKGFHLRGQRRYMEQKIVSILEMVTTVSSSITDAAVQNDFITMDDIGLYGKRVLIRPDINAPVKDGQIGLTERIIAASETIGKTADKNAKVVVIAHQGRAGDADYVSLEQHAKLISKQIGREVRYVNDLHGQEAQDAIRSLKNGEVLVLHNARPGENDPDFVTDIEPLFDYFILDGFSVSHRDQPSVTGFKNIPNIAGWLMERELNGNQKFISSITHPYVELLGGSKISDHVSPLKYGLEEGLIDTVLTGGMLGQLLLLIEGYNLGERTMKELRLQDVDAQKRPEGLLSLLPALEKIYRQYQDRFEIPVDLAYEDANGNRQEIMVKDLPREGFSYLLGDNGTQTAQAYAEILKKAKTAFVKGPQGNYKNDNFRKSSEIALAGLSESEAFWMTGGGDTDAMVVQMGLTPSHRTLAGGAFLRFKTGQILVGVQQLKSSYEQYDIEDAYERALQKARKSNGLPFDLESLTRDEALHVIEPFLNGEQEPVPIIVWAIIAHHAKNVDTEILEKILPEVSSAKASVLDLDLPETGPLQKAEDQIRDALSSSSPVVERIAELVKERAAQGADGISLKKMPRIIRAKHDDVKFVTVKPNAESIRTWIDPKLEDGVIYMNLLTGEVWFNEKDAERHLNELVKARKKAEGLFIALNGKGKKDILVFGERVDSAEVTAETLIIEIDALIREIKSQTSTSPGRPFKRVRKQLKILKERLVFGGEDSDFVQSTAKELKKIKEALPENLKNADETSSPVEIPKERLTNALEFTDQRLRKLSMKSAVLKTRQAMETNNMEIILVSEIREKLKRLLELGDSTNMPAKERNIFVEYVDVLEKYKRATPQILYSHLLPIEERLINEPQSSARVTETSSSPIEDGSASQVVKETTGTKRHPNVDHVQLYDDAASIRQWFSPDWTEEEAEEMIYVNLSTGKVFPNKQAAERHF
ncbi:MAG: phosphoglycerate kinase, partial [Candidatus Omnitrophica bacterium]|nr:phosphoglycerate kinase [Candidatus Omnitrophota bacterium]